MADIVISGNTSGSVTLRAPDIAGSPIITLPTTTGTLVVTGGAQTIEFAAGSAAAPSITFTGDTNTGIFSPAADTIAFSEGGVESMRIDSAGNVGIGTSSPGSFNAFANQLVVGNGSSTQGITVFASNASSISFADGTAGTAPFQGYITYNHVSDYMAFYANYSGSSSPRLLINSNGTTILQGGNLAANGTGITFPATQSASSDANTLDDYEEGTWTPVPTFGGANVGMSYTSAGTYTKIGRMVTVMGTFNISTKGSSTGVWRLGGLPFTGRGCIFVGGLFGDGFTFTAAQIGAIVLADESSVTLIQQTGGAGSSNWNYLFDTNQLAGGEKFFTVTYFTS